ncbi:MAG: hypothetical protein WC408_00125 [Candidatus Micrarchaeia archaeon]|jgi:hypothetical protein
MPNVTLSVSDELFKAMSRHKEIRWSEVARVAIAGKVEKLEMMDKIASKSKLTMKDVEEINEKIKAGMRRALDE